MLDDSNINVGRDTSCFKLGVCGTENHLSSEGIVMVLIMRLFPLIKRLLQTWSGNHYDYYYKINLMITPAWIIYGLPTSN